LWLRRIIPHFRRTLLFWELQKRTTELESQIADRREFYNDAINVFNTRIQEMPDTIVARMLGMKPRLMFQVSRCGKIAGTTCPQYERVLIYRKKRFLQISNSRLKENSILEQVVRSFAG